MLVASIVIPTHQRRADVLETLAAVAPVARGHDVEVIVVANACSDGTVAAAEALAPDFPVPLIVIDEARAGLSIARNRGIEAARGGILIFIDDDISPDAGWLESYLAAFGDERIDAAGGPIRPRLVEAADPWIVRHREAAVVQGLLGHYDLGAEALDVTPEPGASESAPRTPYGGNLAIRASVPERYGVFREDLGYGPSGVPGEETDYLARIAAGGRIQYVPGASVVHRIQPEKQTRESFIAYQERQGQLEVRGRGEPEPGQRGWRRRREIAGLWWKARVQRPPADPARLARWARRRGRLTELLGGARKARP